MAADDPLEVKRRRRVNRERAARTLTFWLRPEFVLRVVSRFQKLAGFDRSIALASGALTATIPLLIVASSVASDLGGKGTAERIIDRYELTGGGAEAVTDIFAPASGVSTSIGIVGFLFLMIALLSFTRAVQRLIEQAWELDAMSVRNTFNGLLLDRRPRVVPRPQRAPPRRTGTQPSRALRGAGLHATERRVPGVDRLGPQRQADPAPRPDAVRHHRGEPAYTTTLRGFYRLLFQAGNAATHPHLGALVATYTASDDKGIALVPEAAGDEVDPYVGITAYLLLYATGVADHALGWDSLDEALRILGRWDDVRGPGTFLREAHALLDGHDGRRFGAVDGRPVSVERAGAVTTFVAIESDSWTRIRHVPGPIWSLDDPAGEFFFGPSEMTGPVTQAIALARQQMSTAEWRDAHEPDPNWPDAAP